MTQRRVFIGFCWGAAATTWLARLLNSHEDIFCFHMPYVPRFDHFQLSESLTLLDHLFNHDAFGGMYPVAGVTHAVDSQWYDALVAHFGEPLRCYAVTRHPVPRIQSTLALQLSHASWRPTHPIWQPAYAAAYEILCSRSSRAFPDDFESLAFYKACTLVNSITWEASQAFPLFRQEDLVSDVSSVQRLVSHVSDGTCRLSEAVVLKLQGTVVFTHAGRRLGVPETYAAWRPEHREAYHVLVTAEAFAHYRELGYEFPHET